MPTGGHANRPCASKWTLYFCRQRQWDTCCLRWRERTKRGPASFRSCVFSSRALWTNRWTTPMVFNETFLGKIRLLTDRQGGDHEGAAVEQGRRFRGHVSAEIRQKLFFFFGEHTLFGLIFFPHICARDNGKLTENSTTTVTRRRIVTNKNGKTETEFKKNSLNSDDCQNTSSIYTTSTSHKLQLCLRML